MQNGTTIETGLHQCQSVYAGTCIHAEPINTARAEPTAANVILEARLRTYHESFVVVAGRWIQAPNLFVVCIISSWTLAGAVLTALQLGSRVLVPVAIQELKT